MTIYAACISLRYAQALGMGLRGKLQGLSRRIEVLTEDRCRRLQVPGLALPTARPQIVPIISVGTP
jgi:hypothetical protein